jgi:tetratricopeptide (TPR) repeat protein
MRALVQEAVGHESSSPVSSSEAAAAIRLCNEAINLASTVADSDRDVEYQHVLATAYIHRGNAQEAMRTPENLLAAIASYGRAIELRKELPLDVQEYCNDLASAYNNRGNAQREVGTPESLEAATASYDQAIELVTTLPLDVPNYRNSLATTYSNRGLSQEAVGTPESLGAAIASYDRAIELGTTLPLDVAEYRNDLANAYNNRGNAQEAVRTPASLVAAIASFDRAIELREALPLDIPEYRNGLARTYSNRGRAQEAVGTPESLRAAIASYERAIELREALPLDIAEYRNGLAKAHSNRGCAQRAVGTPDSLREAIRSFDRAIELGAALLLDVPAYLADLAGSHSNRGVALLAIGTPDSLRAASASFDRAIELRTALPLEVAEHRNNLASCYSNRGNAQQAVGTSESLGAAIASYNRAIELRIALPLNVAEYCNDLAKAYSNRGNAQRRMGTPESLGAAIGSYDRAIELRTMLPLDVETYRNELAAAYCNRGLAIKARSRTDAFALADAVESFRIGLDLLVPIEVRAAAWSATALGARQALVEIGLTLVAAGGDESRDELTEIDDLAERSLELIYLWNARGVPHFRPEALWFLPRACYVGLRLAPQFVGEVLQEALDPEINAGALPEVAGLYDVAADAIPQVRTRLTALLNSDPERRDEWADALDDLRVVERRIAALRQRYLGGTLEATELQVAFWERAGDPARAAREFESYLAGQPRDWRAHVAHGDFRARRADHDAALDAWREAIESLDAYVAGAEDMGQAVQAVALRVRRQYLPEEPLASSPAVLVTVEQANRAIVDWLQARAATSQSDQVGEALDAAIELVRAAHDAWLAAYQAAREAERADLADRVQKLAHAETAAARWKHQGAAHRQMLDTLPVTLKGRWPVVADRLRVFIVGYEQALVVVDPFDDDERQRVVEVFSDRFSEAMSQLAAADVEEARVALRARVGAWWDGIDPATLQDLLSAMTLRARGETGVAGMPLGRAVERELRLLLLPVTPGAGDVNPPGETDDDGLDGEVRRWIARAASGDPVTLGGLLAIFRGLGARKTSSPRLTAIQAHVDATCARPDLLYGSDDAAALRARLDRIREIRNVYAHAKSLDTAQVDRLFEDALGPEGALPTLWRARFGDPQTPSTNV